MNIQQTWRSLPECLPYEGYTFRLLLRGYFVGYYLTGCHSRKKYKREAFKQGYWIERRKGDLFKPGRCPMPSEGSNFLILRPLFDDDDDSLLQALQELLSELKQNGFPIATSETHTEETEFTEIDLHHIPASF